MAARERFPEELRIAEAVNSIENQRKEITRRINEVRANPRMPEERKQEIIQRLTEQQQRVILRGLQLMIGQD
jgi:enoyl reductase-like protein